MALKFKNVAIGCAVGCAVLVLIGIGSCVGFVTWVGRPGELLDASRLVDDDTTGYVEWTLDTDDPGVRQVVEEILRGLESLQQRGPGGPPLIEGFLRQNQARSNRQAFEELLPLVVAWTAWSEPSASTPLSSLSISIEKLGNRIVLIDWFFGLTFGRSPDIEVVRHGREKIYRLPRSDTAFFLRKSNVFIAADVDTARRIVDRLDGAGSDRAGGADLEGLLAGLPVNAALRGAVVNRDGEAAWAMDWLMPTESTAGVARVDWSRVAGLTLHGGLQQDGSLEAILAVVAATTWSADERHAIEQALIAAFSGDHFGVRPGPGSSQRQVEVAIRVDDVSRSLAEALRGIGDDEGDTAGSPAR